MFVKNIKFNKKRLHFALLVLLIILVIIISFFLITFVSAQGENSFGLIEWFNNNNSSKEEKEEKKYIKWFEFNVSYDVLLKTSKLDINSHVNNEEVKFNWIELISYLACKYGNNFDKFKSKDLDAVVSRLKSGETMDEITKDMKYYSYYFEGYDAALHEFIGEYQIQTNEVKSNSNTNTNLTTNTNISSTNYTSNNDTVLETNITFTQVYGLKAFHPVAKNYGYSHYDDFGASRSYGYKRLHFGNDLMGSIR